MSGSKIVLLTDYEDNVEWFQECNPDFEIRLTKRCYAIPDKRNKDQYVAKLRSGKVVLPNKKRGIRFEKDGVYLLVDYIEKEKYIIANKVYRLPEKFNDNEVKLILWFSKRLNLYYFKVVEIADDIFYIIDYDRIYSSSYDKYIQPNKILNLDNIREDLHDHFIREISSASDIKYVLKFMRVIGYDYDLYSFAKVVKEKYPRVYYHYVQHALIKELIEKEVVNKYGVDTIRDLLGYYKIVDFSCWNQWNTVEKVLSELYNIHGANYACSEFKPAFKEILDKIKKILKEHTISDPMKC